MHHKQHNHHHHIITIKQIQHDLSSRLLLIPLGGARCVPVFARLRSKHEDQLTFISHILRLLRCTSLLHSRLVRVCVRVCVCKQHSDFVAIIPVASVHKSARDLQTLLIGLDAQSRSRRAVSRTISRLHTHKHT